MRVSESERARLNAEAEAKGMNLSDYARLRLLDEPPTLERLDRTLAGLDEAMQLVRREIGGEGKG